MQRLLYVILLTVITQLCIAQQTTISVVRLNNGSVVKGRMLTAKSGDRVKVETPDGSVVYFTKSDIKESTKEDYRKASLNAGEDKVSLNNGSMMKGKIRKASNSNRMRIETPSGSIVYFTEDDIKDIQRGGVSTATTSPETNRQQAPVSDPRTQPVRYDNEQAEAPTSGYRGILEAGYTLGIGDISTSRIEITTSHGYQINNRIFIGLGFGVNLYSDGLYYASGMSPFPPAEAKSTDEFKMDTTNMSIGIPIFADLRVNFLDKGSVIPFAGIKAGYTMGFFQNEGKNETGGARKETKFEAVGFYLQPSVGVKFMVGRSSAINLSMGYAFQTFDHYYGLLDTNDDMKYYKKQKNNGGFNIRVGFEF